MSTLGMIVCVVVGLCLLKAVFWRPVKFIFLTGLGIASIVAGLAMFGHGPIDDDAVEWAHHERPLAELSIDDDGAFGEKSHHWEVGLVRREQHLPKGAVIALGTVMVIAGWLLVSRGRMRPGIVKAFTVLGLAASCLVMVSFFFTPMRGGGGHDRVVKNDEVVKRLDITPKIHVAIKKPTEEPGAKKSKHGIRAKRPSGRADRAVTTDELIAQMPGRAGEIPVDVELAKASAERAKPAVEEPPVAVEVPATTAPAPAVESPAPAVESKPGPAPEAPPSVAVEAPQPPPPAPPAAATPASADVATEPKSEPAAPAAEPAPPAAAPLTAPAAEALKQADSLVKQAVAVAQRVSAAAATLADQPAPATPAPQAAPVVVPAKNRPTWIEMPGRLEDSVYRVSVRSGLFVSVPECQRALDQAIQREADHYVEEYLGEGASQLVDVPRKFLRDHVKKAEFNEVVQVSVGPMQQIHALLEFDDDARAEFYHRWRNAVVTHRLWYAGSAGVLVLALLGTLNGYLKINQHTGGAQKGKLQLAATLLVLVVAGAALLLRWVVPF